MKRLNFLFNIFLSIVFLTSSLSGYAGDLPCFSPSQLRLNKRDIFYTNNACYDAGLLRGIEFSLGNPTDMFFYFDQKDKYLHGKEMQRLVRFFFGFLAVPQELLWVNLSPYEKNRIIPEAIKKLDIGDRKSVV